LHATVVAQVGLLLDGPVVGFRLTAPGLLPTEASAIPAALKSMPPATVSTSAVRPSRPLGSGFSFGKFIRYTFR
jgi:hypothetical protein